ncbi:transporter substrate-binding domain-containing protein [Neorhizobium petrolearium]|uniref:Transporter substrate-binding domain-containing protein n=1 Tax=Neorhizobium petrolearium TaxID=515361 RepID=A0ABY8M4Q8_9HYPH|nr:transporter substrate-binding domain-containing protein [Neorhizobium petrolearium]MCC2608418.1 transporter substrate-binding domain-containing protein [Neorhizobium petrolearium]WGI68696.1 transporter substrate-binding domain-containing protein [Neorhizobium petrolearium]
MRLLIASPRIKGFFNLLQLCLVTGGLLAGAVPGQAAGSDNAFPLTFDARERLSRPDLSAIIRVRILTTVDFPPFNFADQTGRLSGFNVDLAREICAELEIEAKCQIQALPFDELEKALESGAGEAAMAGIAVTQERRQGFAFSRPYLGVPARFARNLTAKIDGDTAAALAGRPVGVVRGTAHELMLKAFFPNVSATPFDSYDAMLEALKTGKVDAVFSDGLRLPFWVAGEDAAKCCALFDGPYLSEKFLGEGLSVMLRKGDPILVAAFDQALSALSRNGRLQDIYLRYFPNGLY